MSSKSWFSPTMPQIKVYALEPQPEWMDQLGEITASSLALVTGASYGIGFAIASAYAECGAVICFNDISQELVDKGRQIPFHGQARTSWSRC